MAVGEISTTMIENFRQHWRRIDGIGGSFANHLCFIAWPRSRTCKFLHQSIPILDTRYS